MVVGGWGCHSGSRAGKVGRFKRLRFQYSCGAAAMIKLLPWERGVPPVDNLETKGQEVKRRTAVLGGLGADGSILGGGGDFRCSWHGGGNTLPSLLAFSLQEPHHLLLLLLLCIRLLSAPILGVPPLPLP